MLYGLVGNIIYQGALIAGLTITAGHRTKSRRNCILSNKIIVLGCPPLARNEASLAPFRVNGFQLTDAPS